MVIMIIVIIIIFMIVVVVVLVMMIFSPLFFHILLCSPDWDLHNAKGIISVQWVPRWWIAMNHPVGGYGTNAGWMEMVRAQSEMVFKIFNMIELTWPTGKNNNNVFAVPSWQIQYRCGSSMPWTYFPLKRPRENLREYKVTPAFSKVLMRSPLGVISKKNPLFFS